MSAYLNDVIRLYLDELVDWEAYFAWSKGGVPDVDAERDALLGIVETAAQICAGLEPETRAGWDEEAQLEDGVVVPPPHITRAYEPIRDADALTRAIHWVLSREGVFLNSSSDGGLLEPTLAAAASFDGGDAPTEAAMRADASAMAIEPLFERGLSDQI